MFLCALHLIKLRQHDSAFRATQLWFWVRLLRPYFISGQIANCQNRVSADQCDMTVQLLNY